MGMTIKGVESRLEKNLFKFLKAKGFSSSDSTFEKEIDLGITFSIGFNVKGYPPNDFSVQTIFSFRNNGVDDYWVKYREIIDDHRNPYPRIISFLISDFYPELDKKYHLRFNGTPIKSFGGGREPIKKEEDIYIYI